MEKEKKTKGKRRRWIIVLAAVVVIVPLVICGSALLGPKPEVPPLSTDYDEPLRGEILDAIEQTEALVEKEPDNHEARLELATLQYQAGYFEEAKETVQPLVDTSEPAVDALFLAAELEYLSGNYQLAEDYLNEVINLTSDDLDAQLQARSKLMYVYYQTNQSDKGAKLFPWGDYQPEMVEVMKEFEGKTPYEVAWAGTEHKTVVPLTRVNPLPILPIEVNGKRVNVFIDTGGSTLILDSKLAEELGIQPITAGVESFASGVRGTYTTGIADSVTIGEASLSNVPIGTLPVKEMTFGSLGGIIGTNVLQQFLSTIDYVNEQLVLYEKSEAGWQTFQQDIKGKEAIEIPFYLADTHFMMAKGSLNGHEDLVFFVDSGLASTDAFIASIQTLHDTGIPVPEMEADGGISVSGAGLQIGGAPGGTFPIETLGLGSTLQHDHTGNLGIRPPSTYWARGFINDGLISHQYLKHYSWTIDFTNMNMILVPASEFES